MEDDLRSHRNATRPSAEAALTTTADRDESAIQQSPAPAAITPGDRLLRKRDVMLKLSVGSSTIYRWIEARGFPRPIELAPQVVRWRLSEIDTWIAQRAAQ